MTISALNTKIGEVESKISNVTGLATTTVPNTKISEVENKIPDVSKSVKKADYDAKILKELKEIFHHH